VDTPPTFDPSGFSTNPAAKRVAKPWGWEILLTPEDAPYAAKLIHVNAGARLSLQVHDVKVETQTLIDGKGFLVLEDAEGNLQDVPLEPGVGYHVAVGQRHRLCAAPDQDVTVYEASTPEVGTTWRLEDDYSRPHQTDEVRAAETAENAESV
jgi:mannose-6-phosphate isomerase-like protein (cupin superfamily)